MLIRTRTHVRIAKVDTEKSRDVDEAEDLLALADRLRTPCQTAMCPRTSTVVHSLLEGLEEDDRTVGKP